VDHRKYQELWASTPRGHLLLPTSFFCRNHYILRYRSRGATINVFYNFGGGCYRTSASTPPLGAPPSMSSSASVVATTGDIDSTPRGPTINVFFNFSGGSYRTSTNTPLGGSPSTSSSTLMVTAARDTGSTP
jgi:hypothetical protein